MAPLPSIRRYFSERPLHLPRIVPFVPSAEDPAIFWFNSERKEIVREVTARVATRHSLSREAMELILNDTALHEIRRLTEQRDGETRDSLGYWRSLSRRIARLSDSEKQDALRDVALRMSKGIAGNFDPRVYHWSKYVVPRLLAGIMRPSSLPAELLPLGTKDSVVNQILRVEGEISELKYLQSIGTLVFVPTHSSNLDSIVLGRALEISGLSPVIYGAGKNLFSNPIISFFMHNLGAYRVDRRIKARIYKDVLKTYSQVMIERGYHSLFFPGGTRSRSNLLETRLKLGLAGSAVAAFAKNRVRGVMRNVFFVPTTINYELVLEGETLIEDWLKSEGKARYIIEDDEFSRVERWIAFFRKVVGMDAPCVIRFGAPLDCFGNPVDEMGRSMTPSGMTIDPGTYVMRKGQATLDAARDAAYTRDLGEVLIRRFRQETVLMATSLVAHVLFRRLVRETPGMDFFARLRLRGEVSLGRDELSREVSVLRDRLLILEDRGEVRLNQSLKAMSGEEIVARALRVWNGYHTRSAAKEIGPEIAAEDPVLLLYYQNRLVPFAVDLSETVDTPAAREIGTIGGMR